MRARAAGYGERDPQRDCSTGHSVLRGGDHRPHDGNQENKCRNRRIDCDSATGCRRISDRDGRDQGNEAEKYDTKAGAADVYAAPPISWRIGSAKSATSTQTRLESSAMT